MARKKKGNPVHGWINLNKPVGMTSMQAVGRVRRAYHPQKIGHAGTLDPLASGVLPIAMGEATKTIPFMQDTWKGYRFTVKWGEQTNTDDAEGDVIATSDIRPTKAEIEAVLPDFIGTVEQMPPQFSAIKINGERAYDIARRGGEAEIKARPVDIDDLTLVDQPDNDTAVFEVVCGKGTYVRSIARDLGDKLGAKGHVITLHRTFVGHFDEKSTISLEILEKIAQGAPSGNESPNGDAPVLLPLSVALDDIPALIVDVKEAQRLQSGQVLTLISRQDAARLDGMNDGEALAMMNDQTPIAIVGIDGITVKPLRVFNL